MRVLRYLSYLIACGMTASTAFGAANDGGTTSAGGRISGYSDNPWFIGRDSASYCVVHDDNFSMSAPDSKKIVSAIVADWQHTLENLPFITTHFLFLDGQRKTVTKKLTAHENCDGSEDLKILLGTINDDVKKFLARSETGFVSFANRENYDPNTGWSSGTVWVAPDSGPSAYKNTRRPFWKTSPKSLSGVLLHELGHVFGFQHNQGDFMGEDFPEAVADWGIQGTEPQDALFSAEDFLAREKYSNLQGEFCVGMYGWLDSEHVYENLFNIKLPSDDDERTRVLENSTLCLTSKEDPHSHLYQGVMTVSGPVVSQPTLVTLKQSVGAGLQQDLAEGVLGYYRGRDPSDNQLITTLENFLPMHRFEHSGAAVRADGTTLPYQLVGQMRDGNFEYRLTVVANNIFYTLNIVPPAFLTKPLP